MNKKLCIHGHFYQPPREDPWMGRIFTEASAAPMRHWNQRITRESYAPLAWARRLDESGRIKSILNCYEWMSFNVGPTLMQWLEREAPELLERVIEADRKSLARWGHGNALAQIYHHVIMPLASPLDKKVEVAWALENFRRHFGREAEGMWLSECAADSESLEVLADNGIKFVILSPYQAKAVSDANGARRAVSAPGFSTGRPYKVELSAGKSMAVFFYDAPTSQAIAFEGLLRSGESFWQRILHSAGALDEGGLVTLATDGETYGHHFTFGEMALAYVLEQGGEGRNDLELTNFAAYLADNPPEETVTLHEPSSWSCAHGVERWRSNCGCSTGGHAGWNQEWRAPLREGLSGLKSALDRHYFVAGAELFDDPEKALLDFGKVLSAGDREREAAAFTAEHVKKGGEQKAWDLLYMQESALSSLASCAWFFDDVSRIEPVKAMSFALKAMELAEATGAADPRPEFEAVIARAVSNKPDEGNGLEIFRKRVLPVRMDNAGVILFAYLHALATNRQPGPGESVTMRYPLVEVQITIDSYGEGAAPVKGRAVLSRRSAPAGEEFGFEGQLPVPDNMYRASFYGSLVKITEGRDKGASRGGRSLARHLGDFLSCALIETCLDRHADARLAAMSQVLSSLQKAEEGQDTQIYAQGWAELLPYLPVAAFFTPSLTDDKAAELASLVFKLNPSVELKRRAGEILTATLADLLDNGVSDDILAHGLSRAASVMPGLDMWALQNRVFKLASGGGRFKRALAVLGFSS